MGLVVALAANPTPQIRLYQNWLAEQRGLTFACYDALWQWSVNDLDAFWQSIWDYFEVQSPTPHTAVLAERTMPLAKWFPGAELNYAAQVLRHVDAAHACGLSAVIAEDELGTVREIITRLLHRFERDGWVELSRECITVRDSAALRSLAALQPR